MGRLPRWFLPITAAIVLLAGAAYFGARAAVRTLEAELVRALGPGTQVGAIRAGATAIEVENLVIPAGEGWPAAETLRAERVRLVPAWRALLTGRIEIARVEIEKPYLSLLRTRDGRLRVLPSLLEREPSRPADEPRDAEGSEARGVAIREISLEAGTIELFDATVASPPWKLRFTEVEAQIGEVVAPSLASRMPLTVRALLDGPQHDGRVALDGWLVAATRDLELRLDLAAIDLLALEPYLVEATKARLSRGTLDLGVTAKVEQKQLHAPGQLTLSNLAFARGGRASAKVLGVPRDLLIAALQAKGGRISLDFSLDGRIDDPKFSLNETASTRIAVALAKELGLSVSDLVEGTVGLGLEGVEGAGKAAGGVGSALRKLIPRR